MTPAARDDLHRRLAAVGVEPCCDNSCIFGRRGGMGTNGGCRCLKNLRDMSSTEVSRLVQAMAVVLREYAEDVADSHATPAPPGRQPGHDDR